MNSNGMRGRRPLASGALAWALAGTIGGLAGGSVGPAQALSIDVSLKTGTGVEAAPVGVLGAGALLDIAEAAASVWTAALDDGGAGTSFDIEVAWGDLGDASVIATTFVGTVGGGGKAAGPAVIGASTSPSIWFNSARSDWFMDADPLDPSEFGAAETIEDGAGNVTGQFFVAETSPLDGVLDMFTVMLHEIGHAIGFLDYTNSPFDDGGVTIAAPLPMEGYEVPLDTIGGGHVFVPLTPEQESLPPLQQLIAAAQNNQAYSHALFFHSIAAGERRLPSLMDLVAMAQVVGYELADPDAALILAGGEAYASAEVPVPAAGLLALSGLGALGIAGWRRRRRG